MVPIKFQVVQDKESLHFRQKKNDTLDRITGPDRTSLKKYHGVIVGESQGSHDKFA